MSWQPVFYERFPRQTSTVQIDGKTSTYNMRPGLAITMTCRLEKKRQPNSQHFLRVCVQSVRRMQKETPRSKKNVALSPRWQCRTPRPPFLRTIPSRTCAVPVQAVTSVTRAPVIPKGKNKSATSSHQQPANRCETAALGDVEGVEGQLESSMPETKKITGTAEDANECRLEFHITSLPLASTLRHLYSVRTHTGRPAADGGNLRQNGPATAPVRGAGNKLEARSNGASTWWQRHHGVARAPR